MKSSDGRIRIQIAINMFIPWATYLWLLVCTAGVLYDTLYIQLRPLSFRYNVYEWKFEPYQVYQFFDTLKINMEDKYVVLQSWLSLVELALLWISMLASLLPSRRVKYWAAMGVIVASAFTFWKTVIYLWYDRRFVTISVERMYSIAVVFYYFTIGQWIVWPVLTVWAISKRIANFAVQGEVCPKPQKEQSGERSKDGSREAVDQGNKEGKARGRGKEKRK